MLPNVINNIENAHGGPRAECHESICQNTSPWKRQLSLLVIQQATNTFLLHLLSGVHSQLMAL